MVSHIGLSPELFTIHDKVTINVREVNSENTRGSLKSKPYG